MKYAVDWNTTWEMGNSSERNINRSILILPAGYSVEKKEE